MPLIHVELVEGRTKEQKYCFLYYTRIGRYIQGENLDKT